jgi:hypothetical protein
LGKLADPDRKRRFVPEARAASALNHSHIVTARDIDLPHRVGLLQGLTKPDQLDFSDSRWVFCGYKITPAK